MSFYEGSKLLSLKDSKNRTPEIYISIGNRCGGKTTFFNKWFFRRFIKHNEKFILLFRHSNELDMCWENFTSKIIEYFPNYTFTSKINSMNVCELYANDILCGWGIALNNCDKIKRISHLLSEAKRILFDDFLPETQRYLKNEIDLFISVHTSIAREFGKHCKYLPCYLISNNISIVNPYFSSLGISKMIDGREYYKGEGWVLEKREIISAQDSLKENTFNIAFKGAKYLKYSVDNVSLVDNETNIIPKPITNREVSIIKIGEKTYSLKEINNGLFVDKSPLWQCGSLYTTDYFTVDNKYKYIKSAKLFLDTIKWYLDMGKIFYIDLETKYDFIEAIS